MEEEGDVERTVLRTVNGARDGGGRATGRRQRLLGLGLGVSVVR